MPEYDSFPENSRVWIYQADQNFDLDYIEVLLKKLATFAKEWTSHNNALHALAMLYYERFIVLMVDESKAGASGCSIDKSVHFIQSIEKEFNVQLFDRMNFAFKIDNQVYSVPHTRFSELYQDGLINDETIVFNNLVNTKIDFETKWEVALGQSWHKQFV